MQLTLKPDLEEARQRWDAFWRGDKLDRPMLLLRVRPPRPAGVAWPYPVRPDLAPEPQIDRLFACLRGCAFLAEAVPSFMLEFAAEHFAALLGAEIVYDEDSETTGWVVPFVESWDETTLRLQRDGIYWQRTLEFIRAWRWRCDGKLIVNAPVLSAGLDALSAVRGPERLLMDLVDCPDAVQRALAQVRSAYGEIVNELARELAWDEWGTCNWCGLYSRGYLNTLQCDFSCMISPAQFAAFGLPALRDEASHYDHVTYHLDGPQARRHLPAVCTVPGVEVIQYVPLPGEDPEHVESVYREALELGKAVVRPVTSDQALALWRKYGGARMIFDVQVAHRREAERLLAAFT